MLRAHQLRAWNRRASEKSSPATFGRWLRMAWAEAKAGTLPSFAPAAIEAAKVETVRSTIIEIENRDRLFPVDYDRLAALRAERDAIAIPAGHRRCEVHLLALTHDPGFAAVFGRAEHDGLAVAEIDRPPSPAPTRTADRELELA